MIRENLEILFADHEDVFIALERQRAEKLFPYSAT